MIIINTYSNIFSNSVTDIGTENSTKIESFYKLDGDAVFPLKSNSSILQKTQPNKIRISITFQRLLLLFINDEPKYHINLPFLTPIKYISFTNLKPVPTLYYLNCFREKTVRGKPDYFYLAIVLLSALTVSFSINIIAFIAIFLSWN